MKPMSEMMLAMGRKLNEAKEAAAWRLLRRYLGEQCPTDVADVATVLEARGVHGHWIIASPTDAVPRELILTEDNFGVGVHLNDIVILDREPLWPTNQQELLPQ